MWTAAFTSGACEDRFHGYTAETRPQNPPAVRSVRAKSPGPRTDVEAGERHAGVYGARQIHVTRLDGMDAGISVRRGAAPVRRDRGGSISRTRTAQHDSADGHACLAPGRARPRVQQCLHLRKSVAADAGRKNSIQRTRAGFLRAGPEGFWRYPGCAVDKDRGRNRLHPFIQWTALAFRGHDSLAALACHRSPTWPRADG